MRVVHNGTKKRGEIHQELKAYSILSPTGLEVEQVPVVVDGASSIEFWTEGEYVSEDQYDTETKMLTGATILVLLIVNVSLIAYLGYVALDTVGGF